VLQPKLSELDLYGIQQLQDTISNEHDSQKEDTDHQLTNRETEILRLIVKGYLNKEIADELNISLNTVLTHRKNIISKTGIKTVSGLTFYCIRKGLITM
jgi:DNA-binding NarL/FixJ family response regulator